jgi:hypothetical protein
MTLCVVPSKTNAIEAMLPVLYLDQSADLRTDIQQYTHDAYHAHHYHTKNTKINSMKYRIAVTLPREGERLFEQAET